MAMGDRHLGHLEDQFAAVRDDLRADLHHLSRRLDAAAYVPLGLRRWRDTPRGARDRGPVRARELRRRLNGSRAIAAAA
jgi:hypothetical protein